MMSVAPIPVLTLVPMPTCRRAADNRSSIASSTSLSASAEYRATSTYMSRKYSPAVRRQFHVCQTFPAR